MITNYETALELLKTVLDEINIEPDKYSGNACNECDDEYGREIAKRLEYPYALIHDFLESVSIQTGVIHDL